MPEATFCSGGFWRHNSSAGRQYKLGGTCCFHLQGRKYSQISPPQLFSRPFSFRNVWPFLRLSLPTGWLLAPVSVLTFTFLYLSPSYVADTSTLKREAAGSTETSIYIYINPTWHLIQHGSNIYSEEYVCAL